MRHTLFSKPVLFVIFVLAFSLIGTVTFSQAKPKVDKNCGCDYFPLCNYDVTKTYDGGKIFRGIRNKDESIVWYNCENGIVTKMWDVKQAVAEMDGDGYYYDTYKTTAHEEIILKFNEEKGASWTFDHWESGDGKSTIVKYSIADKLNSIELDGKRYTDVIKIRRINCGYGYTQENVQTFRSSGIKKYQNCVYVDKVLYFSAEDFYYAKNHGLVKSVSFMNDLLQKQNEYEASLPKKIRVTNINDSIYKIITANLWQATYSYIFTDNGVAQQVKTKRNGFQREFVAVDPAYWQGKWELWKEGEQFFLVVKQTGGSNAGSEIIFYLKGEAENYFLEMKPNDIYPGEDLLPRRIPASLKRN